MSIVEMPGFCYCECHEPGSMVMHCAPCCAGMCPTCKRDVTDEAHFEECRERLDEQIKQMQEASGDC